ncbi:MAG: carbamoyl phosphate synthase large subunit, partial [Candidatus Omnitrophica bacterium]|nr:carbamoyl phosphate synthase large subunit [Candidatus Omnitrophota bacterium]
LLGPEMRSTGEVLGMASSFGMSFYKAQEGTKQSLPAEGTVLLTIAEKDRNGDTEETARQLADLGFKIKATEGTHKFLENKGIKSELISKLNGSRPNIVDAIKNNDIQLVINTPLGKTSQDDDSYIRKSAIKHNIPYITTLAAALATAKGIAAFKKEKSQVRSLQEYHADIK